MAIAAGDDGFSRSVAPEVTVYLNVNRAFASDDMDALSKYVDDKNTIVAIYAKLTKARAALNREAAYEYVSECLGLPVHSPGDKFVHFECLVSRAAMSGELGGQDRDYYIFVAKSCAYAEKNKQDLRKLFAGTGSDPVGGLIKQCASDAMLGSAAVRYNMLPYTTVHVAGIDQDIPLSDGRVTLVINGKPMSFILDTGETDISMNYGDAEQAGILDTLYDPKLTNYKTDFFFKNRFQVYIASSLRMGAVRVSNAYIMVSRKSENTIGLKYLRLLGKLKLNSESLRSVDKVDGFCSPFHYIHAGVNSGASEIVANMETTVGRLSVMLDTGDVSVGGMPQASLYLFPLAGAALANRGLIKFYTKQKVFSEQNGRSVSHKVQFFKFGMAGDGDAHDIGLVDWRRYPGKNSLDGILGGTILSKHNLFLDFKRKEMCLSPRRQGLKAKEALNKSAMARYN